MDIEKSQRLIKCANLIKDMVEYKEISEYLLQSKVLTLTDHQGLSECIQNQGNSYAMEDLIHILGLRRGGFNAFVEALRQNDYDWIADQMDPQTKNCEDLSSTSTSRGIFPTLANGLKKKKSRNSERLSSETIFTSYRDNMPMDLGTIRPPRSRVVSQEIPPSRTKFLQHPAKFISASLDNLKLDNDPREKTEVCQSSQMDLTDSIILPEIVKGDEGSSNASNKGKRSVILYNIPEPETVLALSKEETQPLLTSDVKIISKIAQKLQLPDEHLKGLKAVRVGRVAKAEKSNAVARPLKVKFKSQEARDRFISLMQNQIEGVFSKDFDLGEIQMLPYDKIKGTLKRSKSNWWGQSRFLSLKKSKLQKIKETNS